MITGIDHVVIAVTDLREAAGELASRTGLHVESGGRHPALGTANCLAWLGDTYLELVAATDPAFARHSWIGAPVMRRLERGNGFATLGLSSGGIAADVARLRVNGSTLGRPAPGERMRPDGGLVRWTTSMPGSLGPGNAPFLIEHEPSGPEWSPLARMARAMQRHPVGGRARLDWLEIGVDDPVEAAAAYLADLGLPFAAVAGDAFERLVGSQTIRLVSASRHGPSVTIGIKLEAGPSRRVDSLGCRFLLDGPPA